MKRVLLASTLSALCLGASGGCEKRYSLRIDVLDGQFVTPSGVHKIGLVSEVAPEDPRFQNRPEAAPRFLVAKTEQVQVFIAVVPHSYHNEIIHDRSLGESLEVLEIAYEWEGQSQPIEFRRPPYYLERTAKTEGRKSLISYHSLELPLLLGDLDATEQTGSFVGQTVPRAREREDEVHRLLFRFSLDDEEYRFDAKFRFVVEVERYLGVPGGAALP